MTDESTYTAQEIVTAARELRQAAGAEEQPLAAEPEGNSFTTGQVLSMLTNELRLLRERGFSDAHIADLLNGFDICVSAAEVQHHGPTPRFVE